MFCLLMLFVGPVMYSSSSNLDSKPKVPESTPWDDRQKIHLFILKSEEKKKMYSVWSICSKCQLFFRPCQYSLPEYSVHSCTLYFGCTMYLHVHCISVVPCTYMYTVFRLYNVRTCSPNFGREYWNGFLQP